MEIRHSLQTHRFVEVRISTAWYMHILYVYIFVNTRDLCPKLQKLTNIYYADIHDFGLVANIYVITWLKMENLQVNLERNIGIALLKMVFITKVENVCITTC